MLTKQLTLNLDAFKELHLSNQQEKIIGLLARNKGSWVALPDILSLGVAQYNTRLLELRLKGFRIDNKIEWVGRIKHSWYKLQ